jgi:hypothetical protein
MIRTCNPKARLPCATTIQRRIMAMYDEQKILRDVKLSSIKSKVSFAIDLWTSPNQIPFMGIVIHYINDEWEPESWLLDFVVLRGSHTGRRIFECFYKAIEPIESKLLAIVLDNASNNNTFIEECIKKYPRFTPDHRIHCLAHVLHLAARVSFGF